MQIIEVIRTELKHYSGTTPTFSLEKVVKEFTGGVFKTYHGDINFTLSEILQLVEFKLGINKVQKIYEPTKSKTRVYDGNFEIFYEIPKSYGFVQSNLVRSVRLEAIFKQRYIEQLAKRFDQEEKQKMKKLKSKYF